MPFIYEVEAEMGQPDGPWELEACKSRMDAGDIAKRMAEDGAYRIVIHISVPLPRKKQLGIDATDTRPSCLGGNCSQIVHVLNGKWRQKTATLLYVGADEIDPKNIYTMVMKASHIPDDAWEEGQ